MKGVRVDLEGRSFGKLVVERLVGRHAQRRGLLWECRCGCGRLVTLRSDQLLSGRVRSCGDWACRRKRTEARAGNVTLNRKSFAPPERDTK